MKRRQVSLIKCSFFASVFWVFFLLSLFSPNAYATADFLKKILVDSYEVYPTPAYPGDIVSISVTIYNRSYYDDLNVEAHIDPGAYFEPIKVKDRLHVKAQSYGTFVFRVKAKEIFPGVYGVPLYVENSPVKAYELKVRVEERRNFNFSIDKHIHGQNLTFCFDLNNFSNTIDELGVSISYNKEFFSTNMNKLVFFSVDRNASGCFFFKVSPKIKDGIYTFPIKVEVDGKVYDYKASFEYLGEDNGDLEFVADGVLSNNSNGEVQILILPLNEDAKELIVRLDSNEIILKRRKFYVPSLNGEWKLVVPVFVPKNAPQYAKIFVYYDYKDSRENLKKGSQIMVVEIEKKSKVDIVPDKLVLKKGEENTLEVLNLSDYDLESVVVVLNGKKYYVGEIDYHDSASFVAKITEPVVNAKIIYYLDGKEFSRNVVLKFKFVEEKKTFNFAPWVIGAIVAVVVFLWWKRKK